MQYENVLVISGSKVEPYSCSRYKRRLREIPLSEIEDKLEQAFIEGRKYVHFNYDAFASHPQKTAILKSLVQKGISFGMTCSFKSLASRKVIANLKKLGLKKVDVTLHAGQRYPYFLATGVDAFEKTLSAIRNALLEGVKVKVILPVTRYSHNTLKQAVVTLQSMPGEIELRFLHESGSEYSEKIRDAIEYKELLQGRANKMTLSAIQASMMDTSDHVDLSLCPFKHGEKLVADAHLHILVKYNQDEYRLAKIEDVVDNQDLLQVKYGSGLIFVKDNNEEIKLVLEDQCRVCRQLISCHACFRRVEDKEEN